MIVLAIGMIGGGFVANNYLSDPKQKIELSSATNEMLDEWNLFHGETREIQDSEQKRTSQSRVIMPTEIFSFNSFSSPVGWIFIVIGGFLVGFGTRWANGCTSGHAIMGLSLLNPGSLVAVIGFFIGGLAVSWFVIPNLL